MRLLREWLNECTPSHRVLDLGSGRGSFNYEACRGIIVAADSDFKALLGAGQLLALCANSNRLPFAHATFQLIICHHSLEHFRDLAGALAEIRRVLTPKGGLFASVPDGFGLSERLYRLLLAGGGHVQRFTFDEIVRLTESATGLHLAAWKELCTSFNYVDKKNLVPAPRGRLPGPFPRRMRWLGRLPAWSFSVARLLLNIVSRFLDRWFGTKLSLYGWTLAFDSIPKQAAQEPCYVNVCMHCGNAAPRAELVPVAALFYRCAICRRLNPLFRPTSEQS